MVNLILSVKTTQWKSVTFKGRIETELLWNLKRVGIMFRSVSNSSAFWCLSKYFLASNFPLTLPSHNATYRKKKEEEEDYQESCCPWESVWWPHLRRCKVISKVETARQQIFIKAIPTKKLGYFPLQYLPLHYAEGQQTIKIHKSISTISAGLCGRTYS